MKYELQQDTGAGVWKLYSHRVYLFNENRFAYRKTPVTDCLDRIYEIAKAKGYSVYRYQTNRGGNFNSVVTWAVTFQSSKPVYSRDCLYTVSFTGLEGVTSNCKAYRSLSCLEKELRYDLR